MTPEAIEAEVREVLSSRVDRLMLGRASLNAQAWFFYEQLNRALNEALGPRAATEVSLRERVELDSPVVLVLRRTGSAFELSRSTGEVVLSGSAAQIVDEAQKGFRVWQKSYVTRAKDPVVKAFLAVRLDAIDIYASLAPLAATFSGAPLQRDLPAARSDVRDVYARVVGEAFPLTLHGPASPVAATTFSRALTSAVTTLARTDGHVLGLAGRHLLYVSSTAGRLMAVGELLQPTADALIFDARAAHRALLFLRDHGARVHGSFGVIEGRLLTL